MATSNDQPSQPSSVRCPFCPSTDVIEYDDCWGCLGCLSTWKAVVDWPMTDDDVMYAEGFQDGFERGTYEAETKEDVGG